jgi:hypothetical protein
MLIHSLQDCAIFEKITENEFELCCLLTIDEVQACSNSIAVFRMVLLCIYFCFVLKVEFLGSVII